MTCTYHRINKKTTAKACQQLSPFLFDSAHYGHYSMCCAQTHDSRYTLCSLPAQHPVFRHDPLCSAHETFPCDIMSDDIISHPGALFHLKFILTPPPRFILAMLPNFTLTPLPRFILTPLPRFTLTPPPRLPLPCALFSLCRIRSFFPTFHKIALHFSEQAV